VRPTVALPVEGYQLTGISSKAYEHPADRAATAALKAIPHLDRILRRVIEFGYERALRRGVLGSAVRLGSEQLSDVWRAHERAYATLDVEPADILVLQNAGPHSPACMPEAGYLPIPKKLAQRGVKDMVRISDARMSGTAFGTIVLHVTPDAASGGPLGLVKSGDRIRLSVKSRSITLLVDDAELKKRAAAAKSQYRIPERGYARLFAEQILGADEGCDFKFLMPR